MCLATSQVAKAKSIREACAEFLLWFLIINLIFYKLPIGLNGSCWYLFCVQ